MQILLTAINAKYIHSNLAVYSLRAYAGENQKFIGIAEYTINQPVDEILADLYEKKPEYLCFSCYLWNITYVEQLVREIPKILPHTELWLGGPEVSYDAWNRLETFPQIRGILCGEGEETFRELAGLFCRCGENGCDDKRLREVRGIVFRTASGEIVQTEQRPALDLSAIPFVYQEGDGSIEHFSNRIVYYESSRGCPFSCSYCLSSVDKCLRFRDLRLVKQELQFFIDHKVPQVKFVDRTFNCRHDHAMEIWTYILEHDIGITNFHFEIAADLLNEEELALIGKMRPGLIQLEIGIQSANERTISEIHRTMKLDQVAKRVGAIHEKGNVHQHLDLIAGLPYEDYESFRRSFDCVYQMRPDQLQLGFLKVLKGSLMYERAEEYGLLYQDCPPYEVLSTKWLSYGEIIRLKRVEEMVEVYYNSSQFRHTLSHLEQEFDSPFVMFEELGEYYEKQGLFGKNHSRIARYEILYRFLSSKMEGMPGVEEKLAQYTEWLTYDLYLRDNVKNRPWFLGETRVEKEESAAFYRWEAREHGYLKGYEGYDGRQIFRMTHLERIGGRLLLFDYRSRNPLNQDAQVHWIQKQDFHMS